MSETSYKQKIDFVVSNEIFAKKIPDPTELLSILKEIQNLSVKYRNLKNHEALDVQSYENKVFYENKSDGQDLYQQSKVLEDLRQKNETTLDELIRKCRNIPVAELEELLKMQKKIIELILGMYPEAEKLDDEIKVLTINKYIWLPLKKARLEEMKANLVRLTNGVTLIAEGITEREGKKTEIEEVKRDHDYKKAEIDKLISEMPELKEIFFAEKLKILAENQNIIQTSLSTVNSQISQLKVKLAEMTTSKNEQIELNNNSTNDINTLTAETESNERLLEPRKEKFENDLNSRANAFRSNKKRIEEILSNAGYSSAQEMIKDAKNIKEEIEIKQDHDQKYYFWAKWLTLMCKKYQIEWENIEKLIFSPYKLALGHEDSQKVLLEVKQHFSVETNCLDLLWDFLNKGNPNESNMFQFLENKKWNGQKVYINDKNEKFLRDAFLLSPSKNKEGHRNEEKKEEETKESIEPKKKKSIEEIRLYFSEEIRRQNKFNRVLQKEIDSMETLFEILGDKNARKQIEISKHEESFAKDAMEKKKLEGYAAKVANFLEKIAANLDVSNITFQKT